MAQVRWRLEQDPEVPLDGVTAKRDLHLKGPEVCTEIFASDTAYAPLEIHLGRYVSGTPTIFFIPTELLFQRPTLHGFRIALGRGTQMCPGCLPWVLLASCVQGN